jgi:hypothetical protein
MSLSEKYHALLQNFMSFRDGTNYDCLHEFTREEVGPITAVDFHRWCKFCVYGDADANEGVSLT